MPPSFRWIVPGRLAGSGVPGLLAPLEEDLAFLESQGIRTVFTLTEQGPPAGPGGALSWHHFPIHDMSQPSPRAAGEFCDRVLRAMADGAVLVHCKAGLGRTGTMAACVLVSLGHTAPDAVAELRRLHPGYIQTPSQERFVAHFADFLRSSRPAAG